VLIIPLLSLLTLFTGAEIALAFVVGLMGMYALYETTHLHYHKTDSICLPFIVLRKHHFYHLFHNLYCKYGVATRFWDRVFGTYDPVEKVMVPIKLSLQWLLAEDEIKPLYAKHFQLK
jgi:sterol desaturase/sphingolipid hydroxylase (fatty acid hydroxylase superfamily)